ncbi:methyltransferase domain-containing protein [Leptolyngbya cf. ectocarpi LEGE 11479]|uniref:Methyltransferase domain-containing protein n=1 Tax=Leptolyngbya cf. ectocarpi LEGE 11479 TaxID=1828722 RepID=A0A928WXZ1_LEPEC|nr:methyltransferase domain-containing protein [Leptolyngbya ectocarpi]MBE9065392.1 methyltransferase domain-containing protein [Leptolyngbya cf. ectocarpi LEGE 11479]
MGIGKNIVGSGCFSRDSFILERCQSKRVLHVGCTDYPFFEDALRHGYLLHDKVTKVAQHVVGIDIAQNDIDAMKSHGYDVRLIDAENMFGYLELEEFDVILLADVIEHIANPGKVIHESIKALNGKGSIIITVPNALGIIRFLKSFFKYEQVHPDHLAYYSSGTLEAFALNFKLKIEELAWYQFEVRDKRPIVYLSAAIERVITTFFPWQAEGCIAVLSAEK